MLNFRCADARLRHLAVLHGTVVACYKALPNVGKRGYDVLWDHVGHGLPAEDQLEFEGPSFELLARQGSSE
jgi:hypothetical protein